MDATSPGGPGARPVSQHAAPDLESLADRALVRAVARGDQAALAELYDRHAGWLTLRLARRCASEELVDQAVQDTFLALWRRPGNYTGQGDVGAYIWGIGARRLVDLLRRQAKAPELLGRWLAERRAADTVVSSAEGNVLLGVASGPLGSAIERLAPELRAALTATALDGLSYQEAAHLLGVPVGTVKSRCHRVRALLRAGLA